MEKVCFFLDFANIDRAATSAGTVIDYQRLLDYISEGRYLIDAYCYVPINPRNKHRMDNKIVELWNSGYLVTKKIGNIAGDSYKCNFDVDMTMDMIKIACNIKPEIIVLASGDIDFLPVVIELRKMGIRVEVACFEDAMSGKLRLQSSGFINLSLIEESPELSENQAEVVQDGNDEQDGNEDDEQDNIEQENGNEIVVLDPVKTE